MEEHVEDPHQEGQLDNLVVQFVSAGRAVSPPTPHHPPTLYTLLANNVASL